MSTFQLFVTWREISIIDMCPNSWNCQRKSNITRRVRWSKPIKVGVCCRLAAAQHRVGEKFGLISDLSSDQPLFKLSWVLLKDGKHEPNISSEWRWDGSAPHGTGGREKSWGGNLTKWNKIVMFTWMWLLAVAAVSFLSWRLPALRMFPIHSQFTYLYIVDIVHIVDIVDIVDSI